jgi:predicted nicotinamide N-methyase
MNNSLLASLHHERMQRTSAKPLNYELLNGQFNVQIQQKPGLAIGSVVWSSGKSLAEFLLSKGSRFLVEQTVIELGAGVGLPGLAVAHHLNPPPKSIVLTDRQELLSLLYDGVELLPENRRNLVQVLELEWNNLETIGDRKWDVCIAADVVYDANCLSALARTVHCVTKPGGLFILGYKVRNAEAEQKFFEELEHFGFKQESSTVQEDLITNVSCISSHASNQW